MACQTNSHVTDNLAADAFTVTVYSGATVNDTNSLLFTVAVPAPAVDGQVTVNGVLAGRPANFYAVADPEHLLPELDEANNVAVAR